MLLDIGLGERVGSGIALIAPLLATGADVVMLTAETRRTVLASCLEAGAAGWIGKDAFLDDVVATIQDVLAGTPLIGCAAREAMIEELRIERAGQQRALSPFERLTLREREVLAALVDGLSAEEIADTQYVALTTVRSQIRAVLQQARRPLPTRRRRPRQPHRLETRRRPSSRSRDRSDHGRFAPDISSNVTDARQTLSPQSEATPCPMAGDRHKENSPMKKLVTRAQTWIATRKHDEVAPALPSTACS